MNLFKTLIRLKGAPLIGALLLTLFAVTSAPAFAADEAPAAAPAAVEAAAAAPAEAAPAAPEAPKQDSGNTAWMLTSTALVLLMTVPGLALFYGGMVRKKNILATAMQSFTITCLITVLWAVIGYSIAFTDGSPYFGGMSRLFLMGLEVDSVHGLAPTIPEAVFMCFQMTFAIITPALICGAFADRMKFSAMVVFMIAWSLLVYAPIAHWVWHPSGWLFGMGVLDYAGGTVVHVNAGIAGLVCALVMGKRLGYGTEPMPPYNLLYALIGASLLWVGWFGFNAGSAVSAGANAGMAMAVTQIATGMAGLTWMFMEWMLRGKPSVLGIISGAVAGLVAITPASGFVDPVGALVIGLAAGVFCYFGATSVKHMFGYDDSLDAFGVHGVGGIIGAILTGVFARASIMTGSSSAPDMAKGGLIDGHPGQVITQIIGIGATAGYCAIATLIILLVINMTIGLRVDQDSEREGLDVTQHGEVLG